MEQKEFKVISIELGKHTLTEFNNHIEDLITGSIEVVGYGMMLGTNIRDVEVEADTIEEIEAFEMLLLIKGFDIIK
tara:strand:- start:501 stop:728 length:228 start_codon:yes stop_codon:yes gene_type:complete